MALHITNKRHLDNATKLLKLSLDGVKSVLYKRHLYNLKLHGLLMLDGAVRSRLRPRKEGNVFVYFIYYSAIDGAA